MPLLTKPSWAAPSGASAEQPDAPAIFQGWLEKDQFTIAALIWYALALVLRAPEVLYPGRFWAEDGSVFFQYAWTHSFLDALTAPHIGYFSLVPNVAGILAAHVPLLWAPRVTNGIALIVQLLPALLVVFAKIPGLETPLRKALALLLLLVVPSNPEVYINTANSHFLLCAAAGLILISEPGQWFDRWSKWLILGLAGLTGVASTFLTPFFWLQWWKERSRARLAQAAILTLCTAIQLCFIHRAFHTGQRRMIVSPTIVAGVTYAKFVATPLLPTEEAMDHLESFRRGLIATGHLPLSLWLVTAAAATLFLWLCWRSRNHTALLLAAAAIWITALSLAGSLGNGIIERMCYTARYYYAPQFFCFLALLISCSAKTSMPRGLRMIRTAWLGAVLIVGLNNYISAIQYWTFIFSGPSWKTQVENWHRDPSTTLVLWPNMFDMTLPPKAGK
jgi:hypothetical protein